MHIRPQTFFLFFLLFISAGIHGQTKTASLVSVSYSNDSIAKLVMDIESQTSFKCYYNAEEIDSIRINGQFNNQPLTEVLDKLFANTGYYYLVDDDRILFTKGKRLIAGLPEGFAEPGKSIAVNNQLEPEQGTKRKQPVAVLENKVYEIGSKSTEAKSASVRLVGYVR